MILILKLLILRLKDTLYKHFSEYWTLYILFLIALVPLYLMYSKDAATSLPTSKDYDAFDYVCLFFIFSFWLGLLISERAGFFPPIEWPGVKLYKSKKRYIHKVKHRRKINSFKKKSW